MGSTQEGLKVALHPQPLLSISEHHTRISLQSGDPNARVVGALLGTQAGRDVEIMTSFEVVAQPTDSGALELDHAYFVTRRDQFKQVFPTFDVLGWYSIGDAPSAQDTALHKQFFVYNESPLFLQLSPSRTHSATKDLPVAIYESVLEIVADQPEPTFVPAPYEIVTGEAERVAVEGVSKPEEGQDGGASGSLLIALTTQRNALKMLSDRIAVLVQYLSAVTSGHARADPETLRMIAALLGSLQGSEEGVEAEGEREGRGLKGEFMTEYNDVLLTTYLSALTKQLLTANDLLDKQLLLVNTNSSGKEGGGGGGAGGGGGRSGGGGGASRRSKFEQFV